jgi:hypothetical protein
VAARDGVAGAAAEDAAPGTAAPGSGVSLKMRGPVRGGGGRSIGRGAGAHGLHGGRARRGEVERGEEDERRREGAHAPDDTTTARPDDQRLNGFWRRIVSPRSAPTETPMTGTPASSSTRFR